MRFKKTRLGIIFILIVCTLLGNTLAYRQGPDVSGIDDPNTYVHQKITKEAEKAWPLIPYELKIHLANELDADPNGEISFENIPSCLAIDKANFDTGDDIITGSGEEDNSVNTCSAGFFNHFWQPDDPDTLEEVGNDDYNDGLGSSSSSYRKALGYWQENVIPLYVKGDIDEAYYWLGRTAHLLEDTAQPSHVHLDPHGGHATTGGDSLLEVHTGENVDSYSGEGLVQYNYENLIDGFDWTAVQPTRTPDRWNVDFFRLFWYTAQKTQYWASDDSDGNRVYVDLGGTTRFWMCSGTSALNLWADEGYTSCFDFLDEQEDFNENTVQQEADAVVPHAMRAVAGLYRLFWDTVHSYTWETVHQNNRRTGFTLLKGDLTAADHEIRLEHAGDGSTEFWDDIVITDLDQEYASTNIFLNRKGLEMVVAATNFDYTQGEIYALDDEGDEVWSFTDNGKLTDTRALTVANIDDDRDKEIMFTNIEHVDNFFIWSNESTFYVLDADENVAGVQCTFKGVPTDVGHAAIMGVAVDDTDQDGEKDMIVTEFSLRPGTYHLYSLDKDCNINWQTALADQGSQEAPALADIDNDGKLEVLVVPGLDTPLMAFEAENGVHKWSAPIHENDAFHTTPVVADVDNDGDFEIIVAAYDGKRLFVYDKNGNLEWTSAQMDYTIFATPAVANLDNDPALEIVVATANEPDWDNLPNKGVNDGSVYVFDGSTHAQQWQYDTNAKVQANPAIADIDGDGVLEIIVADYSGTLSVLSATGTLEWSENLGSHPIGSPVIGDLDGDGIAEIAVKHAHGIGKQANNARGPPGNIRFFRGEKDRASEQKAIQLMEERTQQFAALTGQDSTLEVIGGKNSQPLLAPIQNITVQEGDLVDLTLFLVATDADNDTLTYTFEAPVNTTGIWQTLCNSAGTYELRVEVSDGSLSSSQTAIIIVEEACSASQLTATLTVPRHVEQNTFFAATSEVCCTHDNCSTVTVSLDPETTVMLDSTFLLEDATFDEDQIRTGNSRTLIADFLDSTGELVTLKWNISSIPTSTITDAAICLYAYRGSDNNLDVWHASNHTWREQEIDDLCNNGPYCDDLINTNFFTTYLTTFNGFDSNGHWECIHGLGSAIQTEINNHQTTVSFTLNNSEADSADFYSFRSKEYRTAALRPYMNITYREAQTKGLISTTLGTTPFYTTDSNPVNITLEENTCQNITWHVNATGTINTTHAFFTFVNKTDMPSISSKSQEHNVQIQ